jgi:hypothetical protein
MFLIIFLFHGYNTLLITKIDDIVFDNRFFSATNDINGNVDSFNGDHGILFFRKTNTNSYEKVTVSHFVNNGHWLVVWNMACFFPYIGNVIIPTDSYFSEG